jgi:anti-sigma factor RsiW
MDGTRAELACIELVELVSDYLDGELAPPAVARIDRHLAGCDGCTTYVEQMRLTIRAARAISPATVPPDLLERLLAAFRGRSSGR